MATARAASAGRELDQVLIDAGKDMFRQIEDEKPSASHKARHYGGPRLTAAVQPASLPPTRSCQPGWTSRYLMVRSW
jgi:hypothetical protein